ncbi:MAG: hypothetical protein A2Z20_02465 [Bdellovibrionales bacterium RBG_16_40_8]|nr:MAG: hypothetical protein A2Z20_02465 [Bdellovibrionales bacterium RBG_16_40_8]
MEKPNYFRRCHVCGAVCCVENECHINECQNCGKPLAQFRYFDDRLTPIQSDKALRALPDDGVWIPINGLTVYWESF